VADTATNEGPGAKRVGRLVSRALLVLGGAVAGTAAAWLVSGATASADTVEVGTASVTPVTEAADGSLADADHGAAHFAGDVDDATCHQEATTWSQPRDSRSCGRTNVRTLQREVSERAGDSVSDLADDAVLSPAERTLGAVDHIARKPEDTRQVIEETVAPAPAKDFGRQVWQLLDPAAHGDLLPALPGLAPAGPAAPGTGQQAGPAAVTTTELPAALRADALATSTGFQYDDVTGAAGHSRDGHRDLPSPLTPAQLPIAPAFPTAPGGTTTSGGAGGHADGFNGYAPSRAAEAIDTAFAAMSRVGLRRSLRSPGKQPGVTPD